MIQSVYFYNLQNRSSICSTIREDRIDDTRPRLIIWIHLRSSPFNNPSEWRRFQLIPRLREIHQLEQPSKKINSKERILHSDHCLPSSFSLSLSFIPPHSSFFFTSVRLLKNSRTRGELIHPRPRRTARFRPRFIGVSRIYPRRHRLGPVFFVRGTPAFSGRFNPWGVREPREK